MKSKESLRQKFKAKRAAVSAERRMEAREKVRLIDCSKAHRVLSFASLPDEIDTSGLNRRLVSEKKLVLPKVTPEGIVCYLVENLDSLIKGRFGIDEPSLATSEVVDPFDIDLAFVPGLAFDKLGRRIGYGFGFYDRLLKSISKKIGLCFKEQLADEPLPIDPWDVSVDAVLAL